MKYLVHINPTPGSDLRVVEVEAEGFSVMETGYLLFHNGESGAAFSPAVWNYVEPKK